MRIATIWMLAAGALWLLAGCPTDQDDDDTTGADDDGGDDDGGDDDTIGDDDFTEAPEGCLAEPGPTPGPGICAEEAPCRWDGLSEDAKFGFSLDAGPDFDGDGVADFAVGAKSYTDFDQEGMAMVYPGLVATTDEDVPRGRFIGPQPLAFAGFSLALLPDVDGDGFDDLIVGATGVEDIPDVEMPPNCGTGFLIHGGEWPPGETGMVDLTAATWFYGESYYARTGWILDAAGDVNGDGLGDILLSGELQHYDQDGESYRQGRAYVVFGQAGGYDETFSLADADVILDGDEEDEMAGESLAGGVDLDGDQVPDLVIGAPYHGTYAGRTYVVSGADIAAGGSWELADVATVVPGTGLAYDAFGWTVASPGDLNGDGLGDFVVGVPGHDVPDNNGGGLVIYPGTTQLAQGMPPDPLTTISAEWDEHDFGLRAIGGDIDGDGATDLVVSAIYAHQRFVGRAGRVYGFLHRDDAGWGTLTSAGQADADYTGAGVRDYLGYGIAATDLDLDGADDLLLGAAYHDTANMEDRGRVYMFWGG